jgi:hypothetical protein
MDLPDFVCNSVSGGGKRREEFKGTPLATPHRGCTPENPARIPLAPIEGGKRREEFKGTPL